MTTFRPRSFILALEASTTVAAVALASIEGRLISHHWNDSNKPASAKMLADIERLHEEHAIRPGEIRAIAVPLGPGAFTGLRVALAEAKTLAYEWGARLYGFSSLEMTACRWPVPGDIVAVAHDARRGEVYSGCYRIIEDGRAESLRPDHVESISDFLAFLASQPWSRIHLGGSGMDKYAQEVSSTLADRGRWIPAHLGQPAADALALTGAAALRNDQPGIDPLAVGPLYLRASDAEKRHGIDVGLPHSSVVRP